MLSRTVYATLLLNTVIITYEYKVEYSNIIT